MLNLSNHRLTVPIPIINECELAIWRSAEPQYIAEISQNDEPLVEVRAHGIAERPHYIRSDGLNFPFGMTIGTESSIRLRRGVIKCLKSMNDILDSIGLEVVVLDGYRSFDTQKAIWRHFRSLIRQQNATASEVEIDEITADYSWNPTLLRLDDFSTWPVHMTGGSVDLTLKIRRTGEDLFMGSIFDDPSAISHSDWFERVTASKGRKSIGASEHAALYGRRICYNAAVSAGLSPYWAEWWHYDLGTQLSVRRDHLIGKSTRIQYGLPDSAFIKNNTP